MTAQTPLIITEMTFMHSQCYGGKSNYDVETSIIPHCDLNRNGDPCSPCSELAQIEDQIEELHLRINDLHAKHRSLCLKRNASHKCLVTKLPYEIASDILIRVCLPGVRAALCKNDPETTAKPNCRFPMTLATTCHRWKELVFSIPKLWSSFSIDAYKPDVLSINRHLQLSGPKSPLFIELHGCSISLGNESFYVMRFIKENLHRIAYLCISFQRQYLEAFAVASACLGKAPAAPLLEEFHVHRLYDFDGEDSHHLHLCTHLPRPQKVIASYPLNLVHLDWPYVLQMTYHNLTFDGFCRVLSMAKSLVEFKSSVVTYDSEELSPQPGMTVIHNSIRKLTLSGADKPIQAIFTHITMPLLESVTMSYCDQSLIVLSEFIQRTACQLASLDLSCCTFPPTTPLMEALEHMPMLQALGFRVSYEGEHLRSFLKHLCKPAILLPHLQKFTYSGGLQIPLESFLEVMENRCDIKLPSLQYQVQALQELVIDTRSRWIELESKSGTGTLKTERFVTREDVQRILDLRVAQKTISISLVDSRSEPVDLVKEAMAVYARKPSTLT